VSWKFFKQCVSASFPWAQPMRYYSIKTPLRKARRAHQRGHVALLEAMSLFASLRALKGLRQDLSASGSLSLQPPSCFMILTQLFKRVRYRLG